MLSKYDGSGPGPGAGEWTVYLIVSALEEKACHPHLPGVGAEVQPQGVTYLGHSVTELGFTLGLPSATAQVVGPVARREGVSGPCAGQNLAHANAEANLHEYRERAFSCVWGGGL